MINYKSFLNTIHNRQIQNLYPLESFRENCSTLKLPRKHRGLYWIWSSEDFKKLGQISTAEGTKQVPFDKLISQRKDLKHVCKPMVGNLRVVYNGKGGYRKSSKGFGLRERILQELNCNDHRTGTLHLEYRGVDTSQWAISFFDFDCPKNQEVLSQLENSDFYDLYADALEVGWRLEYGTPILSRH